MAAPQRARTHPPEPLTELVRLGVREGALTSRGWLHVGIARLAERFGIPARAQAVTADRHGKQL